ncbi:nose resistant to fluoxetine protein 6-like isoform X2 [Neocloeon triangulifer]|uniref:nose resistant to fluoxetine protein 6-like isoform X2 n=1 Tax=Neocloeon triangulifer TaxID=2078957 RepID=UPI00286EE290|nr:nose resistant to fluoxetine protein 6-like isoform X2 [Neocloeon triangulifer]
MKGVILLLIVLDANAKIPSGILEGNVDLLGDYEQCLSVVSHSEKKETKIRGKYCLPEIEFSVNENSSQIFPQLLKLAQVNRLVTGNLTDPTFYNVANNVFLVGMCLPDACNEVDAVDMLKEKVAGLIADTPFDADIIIRDGFCRTNDTIEFSTEAIFAIFLLVFPLILSLICWLREARWKPQENNSFLLALSLGRNWKLLWSRPTESDQLGCVNGIRAVFIFLLFFLHKTAGFTSIPATNKLELFAVMNQKWTLVVKMFWNYVDGFIFLSAVTTAYYAARVLQNGKQLNILEMYIKRYIRFAVLLVVIAFSYTHLAPYICSGPLWMRYLEFTVNNCRGKIWTLATFTSSFNGFPNNCYDTSNHLTTDLLLYTLAPFIVIGLWQYPSRTINFIYMLCTLVSYYKYHVIQMYDVPTIAHNNMDRKTTIKVANHLLFPAIMRLPTYLIGLCCGCYLQKINCKIQLNKKLLWLGNVLAVLMAIYCVAWHSETSEEGYIHHYEKTLVYGLIQPFLWAFVLSWLVFICSTGHAESLNKFLSNYWFVMCTRLGLGFNLVQIPVLLYWIASVRSANTFSIFQLFNLHEFLACVVLGTYFTVIYLVPILEMWNAFAKRNDKTKLT